MKNMIAALLFSGLASTSALAEVNQYGPQEKQFESYSFTATEGEGYKIVLDAGTVNSCYAPYRISVKEAGKNLYIAQIEPVYHIMIACLPGMYHDINIKTEIEVPASSNRYSFKNLLVETIPYSDKEITISTTKLEVETDDTWTPTVITKAVATPVNGGFNPRSGAMKITAKVLLGSNTCMARGNQAKLVQKFENGDYLVTAVMNRDHSPARMCTREFRPVYKKISTTVYYGVNASEENIIIENYQARGQSITAKDLRSN